MKRVVTILMIVAMLAGAAPVIQTVQARESCDLCGYLPVFCVKCLWELAWDGLRDGDGWWWWGDGNQDC